MSSRWQYSTSCWFLLPVLSLVIFGSWPFPPFIISQRCCLVPSLSLLVGVIGATCVIGITAWGTRIGGPSAISGVSYVPGSATAARGWGGWRSQGQGSLCYVWDCRVCGSRCCGQKWGVKVPPRLEDKVTGPAPTAAGFPVVTGITVAQRLKLRVLPPWCYGVLWGGRLSRHS